MQLQIDNSEIMHKTLTTLIDISSRKTTPGKALSIVEVIIRQLENKYPFLKHVEITDTRYTENANMISVLSDLNSIPEEKIGNALQRIIIQTNKSLGKDSGYFFIKELSQKLGVDYQTKMREIGIDFSLLQLENQVDKLAQTVLKK